jgi:hypothetical protein
MKNFYLFLGVLVLVVVAVVAGRAVAQLVVPATEPGGQVTTGVVEPSYVSSDPAYQDVRPPDDNPTDGSGYAAAKYSYYLVSGATLRGRSSATQFTYSGLGCAYTTAGTGSERILNTELHLPNGALIKYLRVYYIDTNPVNSVDGFLTSYDPGKSAVDLTFATGPDAFNGGYGFTVSPEITVTVDNELYAYTLIGFPDENNIANQVCGLRIAYYPPYNGIVFLPAVRH